MSVASVVDLQSVQTLKTGYKITDAFAVAYKGQTEVTYRPTTSTTPKPEIGW